MNKSRYTIKDNPIPIRLNIKQRKFIEKAAEIEGMNRSEFMREASFEKAKKILKKNKITI